MRVPPVSLKEVVFTTLKKNLCQYNNRAFLHLGQILSAKVKDEGLQHWFAQMAAQVHI